MAKILTYNSPPDIEKKMGRGNPLKAIWESLVSQDKFTKTFLAVFLLVLIATPFLVNNLLETRQRAEGPTHGQNYLVSHKKIYDENGVLVESDDTKTPVSGPEVLVNGQRLSDIKNASKTTGPVIVDPRPEKEAIKKYIVELETDSLGKRNADLKKRGTGPSERASQVAQLKRQLAQEHQSLKDEIGKQTGKKLTEGLPKRGERRIIRDFDTTFNGFAIELTPLDLSKVKKIKGVRRVVEDGTVQATLDVSVPMIQGDQAWTISDAKGNPITGKGIKIGIIDTGVDYTHPDLGGCFGPGCKVEGGYDFYNIDPDPMDDHGHGTHVAATAGGKGVAADGTKLYGVAPDATIYAYKVLSSAGSGSWDAVVAGIDRCVDPNQDGNFADALDVCSMSLGGGGTPDDPPSLASDYAMENGVVITIAAGNSGPGANTVGTPGNSRESITVGAACKPADVGVSSRCPGPIASFSSRGPVVWTDLNGVSQTMVKPDIVAPGVNICAARHDSAFSAICHGDTVHVSISGTSMATPHVAGFAALMKQAGPGLSPSQIKDAIKAGALPYSGYDENTQGKGLVQAVNSLKVISPNLDFTNNIYSKPFAWIVTDNISSASSTVSSPTFTIYNTNPTAVTGSIYPQNLPAGLTLTTDKSSLTIPASGSATFGATLTEDNNTLVSGKSYSGAIVVDTPLKKLNIDVTVSVPNRITASTSVDFGADSPDFTGTFTSTKPVSVTNLQNLSGTYNATVQCCTNSTGQTVSGITVTPSPSSITLSPNGTSSFDANMSVNNSTVPNGVYKGMILISSGLQQPVLVPFTITKMYKLVVSYTSELSQNDTSSSISFYEHTHFPLQGGVYVDKYSGRTSPAIFLSATKPGPIDVMGDWFGPSTANPWWHKTVVKENLSFTGAELDVTIDQAEATNIITTNYTGPEGNDLTNNFSEQAITLLLKSNNSGAISTYLNGDQVPWNIGSFYFNNVSSNYAFSASGYYRYLGGSNSFYPGGPSFIPKGAYIEHVEANGISASKTLSNTASDLKKVPIFINPISSGGKYLLFNNCWAGDNLSSCIGLVISDITLFKQPPYNYELWTLPIDGALDIAKSITTPIIEFTNIVNSQVIDSPALLFDTNGIVRWPFQRGAGKPQNILPSADAWRIDMGLLPYTFDLKWDFDPALWWNSKLGKFVLSAIHSSLLYDQEWNPATSSLYPVSYRVLRNGAQIDQGTVGAFSNGITTYQVTLNNINNTAGKYDVELYGTATISGVLTNQSYKGSFTIPTSYNASSVDWKPPATTSFDFLSNGIPSQVVDPTRGAHTIKFSLDPGQGTAGTDSITSANVRMMTDVSAWQSLTVSQDPTTKEYSTSLTPVTNANLYTFELSSADNFGNTLLYSFQLPTGTVPINVILPTSIPTSTQTPTPSPTLVPTSTPTPIPSPTTVPTPTVVPITQPVSTTGNITGTVTSSLGGTVSGAKISISLGKKNLTYTTDSLGNYVITLLPPGTYTLKFSAQSYIAQSVSVTVTANTITTKNIVLQKR